jgi:transketolase
MTDVIEKAPWIEEAQRVAAGIRRRVLQHVLVNGEGYLSQACSSAEILAMLYTRILHLAPLAAAYDPGPFEGVPGSGRALAGVGRWPHGELGPNFDRFIVSPAHYALPVYAALIEVGRLASSSLDQFNQDGSTVEMIGAEHSPGFEVTSGSLAQGLSVAAGMALARRLRGDSGRVWVFLSDGEFEEGQTWEALASASFYKLANLRMVVDANGRQCDGVISSVANIEPLADRIRAFGVTVAEVDGHEFGALEQALSEPSLRPHLVIARTDPTRGVPVLAGRSMLHTVRLSNDEERCAYEAAYQEMLP